MANIMKDNVHTYVRELIAKEFEANDGEDKASPHNRLSTSDENDNGQSRPMRDS